MIEVVYTTSRTSAHWGDPECEELWPVIKEKQAVLTKHIGVIQWISVLWFVSQFILFFNEQLVIVALDLFL